MVGRPLVKVWIFLTKRLKDFIGFALLHIRFRAPEQELLFGLPFEVPTDEQPGGVSVDQPADFKVRKITLNALLWEVSISRRLTIGHEVDPGGPLAEVREEEDEEAFLLERGTKQARGLPDAVIERVVTRRHIRVSFLVEKKIPGPNG